MVNSRRAKAKQDQTPEELTGRIFDKEIVDSFRADA